MFGTLHWNPHSKEAEFIERRHGSSNPEKKPACDRCRLKKVKCRNPNNEGCTRCKRLAKMCTFSSGGHRAEHRVQKHAPREEALPKPSWSVSVSSSSKGADKDKDKQPPAAASPGIADNNDSERGHGHSLLDDTFDLSFLVDFEHETSDRDAEDTSNFALFSTVFPSTHTHTHTPPESEPEFELPSMPTTRMSMSAPLLSPPLSSEDEIQQYLPPAGHENPSLFDICIATPPPLHESPAPCQCLDAVVFAVEDFEASCSAGQRAELASITAYQKKVIQRCRSQLKCTGCTVRRETLVLLVFMIEKIVAACGRIVALYRVKDAQVQLHLPSSPSLLVNDDDLDLDPVACTHAGAAAAMSASVWKLLRDHAISSPLELGHLVRVLIFLQLRAVMELLADVKSIGGQVLGETLTANLAQAETRLSELEKDILFR